jgi:hypothetical protein
MPPAGLEPAPRGRELVSGEDPVSVGADPLFEAHAGGDFRDPLVFGAEGKGATLALLRTAIRFDDLGDAM